jgi:hypothetical protein
MTMPWIYLITFDLAKTKDTDTARENRKIANTIRDLYKDNLQIESPHG